MRNALLVGVCLLSLGLPGAAQERTYTNADVPSYRPRKRSEKSETVEKAGKPGKAEPAGRAERGGRAEKGERAERDEKASRGELSSRMGRRPPTAEDDSAFSAYRPVKMTRVAYRPTHLPGAKEVLSYSETAHQQLPERVLRFSNYDREQERWSVYRVNVSDIIEREARNHDLDPLIVEIIIAHESAFKVRAYSGAGACGLMQLMPETAASLGVTDINDPHQNIAAGTRYFATQYRRFGNLHLALAAYNAGPGAVQSYGGVPPYAETISYASSIAQEYESRRKKRT